MSLRDWILGLVGRRPHSEDGIHPRRGLATHVIILDGTMSSLREGCETNAGQLLKLLREVGYSANLSVYYEAGIQWRDWRGTMDVMTGRGINRQIERAYGVLASRYQPGDKIVLVGYSRGAYAVRSLAGVIDMVGLVKREEATVRTIRNAYRYYRAGARSPTAQVFCDKFCHRSTPIEAVAVWDTVKALGLRLPIIWRWSQVHHAFHSHTLGRNVAHGFHALAIDETRAAYSPVMWTCPVGWVGHVEQVWFRGSHGDIGGQIGTLHRSRPLANIPLVWMLERLETCGLALPDRWRDRFPCDVNAPSIGKWRGWSKLFLLRRKRIVGLDPSEKVHDLVTQKAPRAAWIKARRSA